MHTILVTMMAAVALLAGCISKSDPLVPADGLQQKELDWSVGDEAIYTTEWFEGPRPTKLVDTSRVFAEGTEDGYRTIEWNDGIKERIRGKAYQRKLVGNWYTWANAPSSRGEIVQEDTIPRTADDGSVLGHVISRLVTVSPDTTITVPAGTFRCVSTTTATYDLDGTFLNDAIEYRMWYAPGIGMVQFEHRDVSSDPPTVQLRKVLSTIRRH